MIYENERSTPSLEIARDEIYIIDQWNSLKKSVHLLHEKSQKLFFRIVKRASAAPNAQAGCERANSEYNQFKDALLNHMQLPMIKERLRIKVNGSPTSIFEKCGYIKDTNTLRQPQRRSSLSIAFENRIKKIIRARYLTEMNNYKKI